MILATEMSPTVEAEICARLQTSGLSPDEIAKLLGCTVKDVRHRLALYRLLAA